MGPSTHTLEPAVRKKTGTELCSFAGCDQAAAAALQSDALCRGHFISACYSRLDEYDEMRRGPGLDASHVESVRHFVHECTRHADEIEHACADLDNLERAKLLHIILSANELGCFLRRSPRKVESIAIRLSSEKIGGAWEEETETVLLSRYGAAVRCRHAAKPGETLQLVRSDTGQKAEARVAWQRPLGDDDIRIGVEFVNYDNFWGLDWGEVEETPLIAERTH